MCFGPPLILKLPQQGQISLLSPPAPQPRFLQCAKSPGSSSQTTLIPLILPAALPCWCSGTERLLTHPSSAAAARGGIPAPQSQGTSPASLLCLWFPHLLLQSLGHPWVRVEDRESFLTAPKPATHIWGLDFQPCSKEFSLCSQVFCKRFGSLLSPAPTIRSVLPPALRRWQEQFSDAGRACRLCHGDPTSVFASFFFCASPPCVS